jgi:hypothetical protein
VPGSVDAAGPDQPGGQIAASPAAGFLPKDQLSGKALRRFLAQDWP